MTRPSSFCQCQECGRKLGMGLTMVTPSGFKQLCEDCLRDAMFSNDYEYEEEEYEDNGESIFD